MTTIELLERTKAAWGSIRSASAEEKNRLLLAMAESLEANSEDILRENAKDMDAAKGTISDVMLDRLALTESRIHAMAEGIREAAALPDHVGRALAQFKRPNGMTITKRQVPLGLVAIIYESRPNVTSDAAALCIKSGNVCMLRSGKEAYRSSHAIVTALKVLRSRLLAQKQAEHDSKIAAERRSQVGTGDRSERIRTYNYPQGRLTDHRIGLTLYKLDTILNGVLDEVVDALVTADQAEKLKASTEE